MVSQEILDYVKNELKRGVTEDKLRHTLMEHGWPEFEINEAFEKAKAEKPPKTKPIEKPQELKPIEVKPQESTKPPVIDTIKKIVTNKIFIIAMVILIISIIFSFVLPSLLESSSGEIAVSEITSEAQNTCRQYCNSNLCGLFNNPEFPQPELQGKSCEDLGTSCLQANGDPKCKTEY